MVRFFLRTIRILYDVLCSHFSINDSTLRTVSMTNKLFCAGIYLRSSRVFEGDHAVKLIGWDEHNNWLLVNSFGKMWGDEGTFLLPRNHMNGNCDFGYVIVAPILNGTQPFFSNAISFGTDRKLYTLHIVLLLHNIVSKIELTI